MTREELADRMNADRDARILAVALDTAERIGFDKLTRDGLAAATEYSAGAITYGFGSMAALRDAVMTEAVRTERLTVIAQGLALQHRIARDAPDDVRRRAAELLAT